MEEFIASHPKLTASLFVALVGFVFWVGKKTLDNNTKAFERLDSTISALFERLHVVENKQSAMEARCDERIKRLDKV